MRLPTLIPVVLFPLFLTGCGVNNGLPRDLRTHLADRGIAIRPIREQAPLSGRAGFVVVNPDPALAAKIVSTFGLETVPASDPGWFIATTRLGGSSPVTDLWGAWNRPAQFKLKNGAAFEFFFLAITAAGEMVLFAEYAYG